jgi:hypothetical protein
LIRRLWGVEIDAYRDHLFRLDAKSRHNRFCATISDEMIPTFAATAHGSDVIVHGFFVNGKLRAARDLRIVRPFDLQEAEAAFSIEKARQARAVHRGVGDECLRLARGGL